MKQLAFSVIVFAMVLLAAGEATAQTPDKVYRLGVLAPGNETSWPRSPVRTVTLPELAKQGFMEGRNLIVEPRFGPSASLPELARELIASKPDAILAVSVDAIRAARQATDTIPIVMGFTSEDPIASGFAVSLAKPGGNVTGLYLPPELQGKRLEFLHEAVPAARRIATLVVDPVMRDAAKLAAMQEVAARTGLDLLVFQAPVRETYLAAFARMRASGAEALVIGSATEFFRDTEQLAALAAEAKLPTMCEWQEMAARGCLIGYGPSLTELRHRSAGFVARIFRGTPPGDLPIEGPTRFEFAVNLKTARTLGIELPLSLLARADEVIE